MAMETTSWEKMRRQNVDKYHLGDREKWQRNVERQKRGYSLKQEKTKEETEQKDISGMVLTGDKETDLEKIAKNILGIEELPEEVKRKLPDFYHYYDQIRDQKDAADHLQQQMKLPIEAAFTKSKSQ